MLVLGVGMSSSASGDDLRGALGAVLAQAGRRWEDVTLIATTSTLARDQRLTELGIPLAGFDRHALESVAVPSRPGPVLRRLAAPPVAEAAALLAAGAGAWMVVPKHTGRHVTVAAAANRVP